MFFQKKDIEKELEEFVQSPQFANFKLIMEDCALNKFKDMQTNKKSADEMLADKAILNHYMGFAEVLERKLESNNRRKEAELREKINQAQIALD